MPISAADPLLDVAGLSSGYGKIPVLFGVDLKVGSGESGRAARTQWRRRRGFDRE